MNKIDTQNGIIAWFARNHVAANLLMWMLIIGGIFGALTIQKQIFPPFEINIINVRVPYLGAAPQEVEEGVIVKIEEAIKELDGIKQVTSRAVEGLGTVSIEVEDGYDVATVLDEVKVQVDAISALPANTERPVVYRQKVQQDVIWVSVYGDADEAELKEFSKGLRDDIANLPGISSAILVGARNYEIAIELSEVDLQKYGLTFSDVVDRVRQSSIDLPGGAIRAENGDIFLRTLGQAYREWDFAQLVLLRDPDGTLVTLGDIASINDGFVEDDQYSTFNGKSAISVRVRAVGDQNALEISKQVNRYLDEVRNTFPPHINADAWGDSSYYLADRLKMMLENMFFGALLVFIVLSLFLKLKLAFWVIVGLPVVFLGTLMVLSFDSVGISINLLSLFAFILVLGIVVDDAIIMGESAYTEIDKKGHSAEAVITGVKKVSMTATFGVLTTVAAFTPMLMVSGPFGVIWKTIGAVVIVCLLFSLVESKLILPAHLVHMKVKPYDPSNANAWQRFRDFFSEGIKVFIERHYRPLLERAIKHRYTTLSLFLGMLVISIGLFGGGFVRFVFFPTIPSDFMGATVELSPGASIAQRNQALDAMQQALLRMDAKIQQETGAGVVKHAIGFERGASEGEVFVELTKGETRILSDVDIHQRWRAEMPELPGVKAIDIGSKGGPGGGADLSFVFTSADREALRSISSELKYQMNRYPGLSDVNDTFSGSREEIQVQLTPLGTALGITLQQLGQQVRYGFYGAEVQRLQRDEEEIKVVVRYPLVQRNAVEHLEKMRIRTPDGNEVPFYAVADIRLEQGFDAIVRVDGARSVTVSAKVDKKRAEPSQIADDIIDNVIPDLLDKYPMVEFGLQGNTKEEGQALIGLLKGMIFALFAIYALLAIPLRSYSQPLIVMSVIPFGFIGAIVGHLLLGQAVSVLSICGIIALAGVVVNDSLIMVDFVNRARAEGQAIMAAAINAGTQRFRAIVLTSLTTFMGLMPIIFERSLQAQVVIPMAISLAFGILFATVITLFLVPSLYLILQDIKALMPGAGKAVEATR